MDDDVLQVEIIGSVARLTLNRPRAMNALNAAMLRALDDRLAEIESREDIRVVVLTGAGAAFCAGADLKGLVESQDATPGVPDFLDQATRVIGRLRNLPCPVIAALNGVTLAGGLELAMCADFILAAQSARIGDAHANYGVYPGAGGAAVLPRLVPLNVAMYLLFTGATMSAAEMQTHGLVAEVHADDALAEATMQLATRIAQKSPIALRRMKEVARASQDKSRQDALLHEQVVLRQHLRSLDLQEGLRAFAEKRTPQFQGR